MYYLTNFHAHYPDARVIIANCGDTISLSCPSESENHASSSSLTPIMWFRLYENAYPQPLILGDRQLSDDQRFMLRTQNNDRHLEIVGIRKDDEGYYLCKSGNIQSSYNITILSNTCIDIIPDHIHTNADEPIYLICRIRSIENSNEVNLQVEWTRNDYLLDNNMTESSSNYSSIDSILYETLTIKNATRNDTGIYRCRYGHDLTATAQVIVNQYPNGSKSRRLISQLGGNSSSSKASLRTVNSCFYIVYEIVLVTLVALSMHLTITLALLFCISAVTINAAETCQGPAIDSQEDFKWKYDEAPIVIYANVVSVKDALVTITVNCTLKGSLDTARIEVSQLSTVANTTECHYLSINKNYIVFIDEMKPTSAGSRSIYRLADLEEIEINANTAKSFMNDECTDEEDNGIELTMFFSDKDLKCNQFTATCNEANKASIIALNYGPLTKSSTFLGGFRKTMPVPNMDSTDGISGKNTGTGDEQMRGTATISTMWMSMIVFLAGLMITRNI
ncbi:unnamed protein product [Adineta steineri]|uniref:Ig-like domain-containing protein n=1 Tax=Adineta steineri TaxID=433720 RepID=A0A814DFZ2_9BILA|nr:unnamed protein product [Adineta steineri]